MADPSNPQDSAKSGAVVAVLVLGALAVKLLAELKSEGDRRRR
jgi:hypothetical protein